ncbi:hypothetical protein KRX57_01675 [Weeksellaceae bacterium TAE3-ERU29]|nr:hypothetical protein [Weeksellaceae bacterium TAE3-ERU29]
MKKTIICSALAILGIQANAQVEDISVTLSPTASYNWFDNNAAIEDGLMVGGRLGFGFGEYFELRGIYEKSVDLKNAVNELNLSGNVEDATLKDKLKEFESNFESRNVDVERWGGEMKANIPTGGSFAPYITLGTGVQSLKVDKLKDEQIYVSAGVGTKINLSDRVVLNLEGRNTAFNLNNTSVLFVPGKSSDFKDFIGESKEDRMYNWSVQAGLQIYLGGREPGSLTELDRAYLRKFSGGLSGLKFVVEPGVSYIDFNKDLGLKDTYLVGGAIGFDLSQYVGLRGFYYQATKNEEFKKFDDVAMYGGELFAKLNVSRGITPYLTVGGGYINVYEGDYQAKSGKIAEDSYFVKGGLGLTVPVSKYFELFGAANLLYTTSKNTDQLAELKSPNELKQSNMYNVGLRFNLGASADEGLIVRAHNNTAFEDRIDELEKELKKAYRENDSDKAIRVIKEKQNLENSAYKSDVENVRLTPQELQDLVEKTIDEVNEDYQGKGDRGNVNQRINRLERLLLEVNRNDYNNYNQQGQSQNFQSSATNEILKELRELNNKVDRNANQIATLSGDKTVIVNADGSTNTEGNKNVQQPQQVNTATPNQVITTEDGDAAVVKSLFVNEGMSLEAGALFGGATTGTIGIRGHYGFTNSNFELQPDLYLGFGGKGAFGVNANAVYKFNFDKGFVVQPYLGAGIGYNTLDGNSNFGANLIIGTSFNVLDGKLYLDYTALDLAEYNKVSVGYKFGF